MGLGNFFRTLAEDISGHKPERIDAGILFNPREGRYWTAQAQQQRDGSYSVQVGQPSPVRSGVKVTDQWGGSVRLPVLSWRCSLTQTARAATLPEAVARLRDLYDAKIAEGCHVTQKGRDLQDLARRYPLPSAARPLRHG